MNSDNPAIQEIVALLQLKNHLCLELFSSIYNETIGFEGARANLSVAYIRDNDVEDNRFEIGAIIVSGRKIMLRGNKEGIDIAYHNLRDTEFEDGLFEIGLFEPGKSTSSGYLRNQRYYSYKIGNISDVTIRYKMQAIEFGLKKLLE